MKKLFNQEKLNIERLKPKAEDVELNKCDHMLIDEETSTCTICGKHITCNIAYDEETNKAVNTIIDMLESLKMVMNEVSSKKELKVAQSYFDMIPLLKNLSSLEKVVVDDYTRYINACNRLAAEEYADSTQDPKNVEPVSEEPHDEYHFTAKDGTDTFLNVFRMEDETSEDTEDDIEKEYKSEKVIK